MLHVLMNMEVILSWRNKYFISFKASVNTIGSIIFLNPGIKTNVKYRIEHALSYMLSNKSVKYTCWNAIYCRDTLM